MAGLGFFQGQRVELLNEQIVEKAPHTRAHAAAIGKLNTMLVHAYGETHIVRVQLPLDVDEQNQPEPDFAMVPIGLVEHSDPHPPTADRVLEVADSSLALDRDRKAALYAAAGVPEYWIINVRDQEIEVYNDLRASQYRTRRNFTSHQGVAFPNGSHTVRADQLLYTATHNS